MWPYIDNVCRFDFEVAPEDEYMVGSTERSFISGIYTPTESKENSVLSFAEQLIGTD